MSCFYCGKRVSLVRKRVDADFCCEDHRERYHARARRTIETLREADEQIAVSRRLNEGMPLPTNGPKHGKALDELRIHDLGNPLRFGWLPTGLPVSRAELDTYIPVAGMREFRVAFCNGTAPPLVPEKALWSVGRVQEPPRPPRAFTVSILLPQGEFKRAKVKRAALDEIRRARTAPPVELGAGARTIVRRITRRRRSNSMGALMRTAKPPDPLKPPLPSPPIVVTLPHATMALHLGGLARPKTVTVRMPSPGMVGNAYRPHRAEPRPPAPAYVPIQPRSLSVLSTQVRPGAMPRSSEVRGGNRFGPSPDGFRRRQFYNSEPLDRFCRLGFETIAGYRPEMPILAAPDTARCVDVARLWQARLEDASTALPEPRRPAPRFPERLALPDGVAARLDSALWLAQPAPGRFRVLDSRQHLPILREWDVFAGLAPVRRQGELTPISGARWTIGAAEAFAIRAWARPQTRGAKRIAAQSGIAVRTPVFAGPTFVGGRRRVGPSPEKPIMAPAFSPPIAQARRESVVHTRAAILPEVPWCERSLGHSAILYSACRAPIGQISARSIVQPPCEILLGVELPSEIVEMAEGGVLRTQPPARQSGVSFDIRKGTPRLVDRESLERFRRRGYESVRSRQARPHWPGASTPGLAGLGAHLPSPYPARELHREGAAVMFRAHDLPSADAFRRTCSIMDWRLLAAARPGSADWGRESHCALVALPLPLMLPVDALGPIRDWGLAPPPEPEKPPEPIHEDFGAGLANWLCANADWRQDIAGVRTGSLALLRPSLNMSDYELEFLCKIENRSIGWVYRAANTSNYHAVQIAMDTSGAAHLARYTVLGGDRHLPAIAPLDLQLARNSSCRVKLSASGSDFMVSINDKPVCDWSDDRLPEGGIGFFSDGEDRARLYWVKVTPFYEARVEESYAAIPALGAEFRREVRMGV